jgi:RNA polymerase sigma-70 factor (ECF subfamily)
VEQWIEAGDLRRAASSLVVSYGTDVLATCIAMLRDRTAAEDVTQEVFSDALRALSTFRGDSSPRTWLLSIARNRCIDYLRARKRDPWGGALDESASDPDTHADQAAFGSEWFADRSLVLRALDALAEGDRALIVLRFKNGLEYEELATAFGLREGTVPISPPVGALGLVLTACEPATPSESLAARLGALVESLQA